MNKILRFIGAIAVCESAGIIGSYFTITSIRTWYVTLSKPFFNPHSWVFGPVWTVLYALMGISLYMALGKKRVHLKWFWIQLALNSLWSILFFGLRNPPIALLEIILLWAATFMTIRSFWKHARASAFLLLPYIAWITFAGILNLSLVLLNR